MHALHCLLGALIIVNEGTYQIRHIHTSCIYTQIIIGAEDDVS